MAGLRGRAFAGYRLGAPLSGGGFAEVYRAQSDALGGREVAVKIIYPEFAQLPTLRARFEQITRDGRRLDHPHILPLLDCGEEGGYLYLVTPFVAAGSLRERLRAGNLLGGADVGPFFRQVCEAAGYAHSQSVVHGNIKPSNIFLHEGRHVLLGDFGRLWELDQIDLRHAGSGAEAVEFLSPEAIEGHEEQRSDIYSLGAVLFTCVTGRPPFSGTTPLDVLSRHARQPLPHLMDVAPGIPTIAGLDPVVQRAMAKAPDGRFASALALAQAIELAERNAAVPGVDASGPFGGAGPTGPGTPFGANGLGPPPAAPGVAPWALGVAPTPSGPGMSGSGPFAPGLGAALAGGMPGLGMPGAAVSGPPGPLGTFGNSPVGSSPLGAGLGQVRFPPLPASAEVEADMEDGRPGAVASPRMDLNDAAVFPTAMLPAPPPVPGGRGGSGAPDLPLRPTLRVVAPPGPVVNGPPGSSGAPRQGPNAPMAPGQFAPLPGSNALDPRWAFAAGAAPPPGFADPDGGPPRSDQPFSATRLGLPRLTDTTMDEAAPAWHDVRSASWPAPDAGLETTTSGRADGYGDRHGDGYDESAEWTGQTGSWDESAMWGASEMRPGHDHRHGRDDRWGESTADSRMLDSASPAWSSSMPSRRSRWGESDSRTSLEGASGLDLAVDDPWTDRQRRSATPGFIKRQRDRTRDYDEGADEGVSYESLPASPARRRRDDTDGRAPASRPSRRLIPLLGLLALLIVGDGVLLAAMRPDLCPVRGCATLRGAVERVIPGLRTGAETADASPLSISPTQVSLHTHPGAAVTTHLMVTNTARGASAWTIAADLPWLSASPNTGTLPAGASAQIAVMARPGTSIHAQTYTTTLRFAVGGQTVTVPISVVVTPATATPASATPAA